MPILRGCSEVEPECILQVSPYASTLIAIANESSSIPRRVAAIAAFSCARFPVVSNSLPRWLRDPAEVARAQAVLLLSDFPGEFAERALRELAPDASPKVRAAVAEAIGNGKMEALLPTLEMLFSAPVGPTNPVPPLTLEVLQTGGQLLNQNVVDVHTSAGYALLKFDTDQVGNFLTANLSDVGFRLSFLCKLAENNAGPWLINLAEVMEARRARIEKEAMSEPEATRGFVIDAYLHLSGTYFTCWNIIYNYLHELPKEQFADGTKSRYLDVLENAGNTGSREPLMIYELHRMKGLNERAARFRSQNEKKFAVYNIGQFFDKVDLRYTNSPGKTGR
ncbi:MAG: hypothetical protein DME26_04515 [Verrucomicrobia bacterium]|nr:MAG: hypothetical protein DME26_04515 [Verrucomicrobiota bacterium]